MRTYLLLVALGCFLHQAHAQALLVQSIYSRGVNYGLYDWEGAGTDLSSDLDPCPSNNILAFWDSVEEYKDFLDEMDEGSATSGDYTIGLRSEGGDTYMRTHNGRRLAPFVNYWETSTDRTVDGCTKLSYGGEGSSFYYSPWSTYEGCTLEDDDLFICMDSSDPSCTEDCRGEGEERSGEYCYWNPAPGVPYPHAEAVLKCSKNGGELINLLDPGDVTELENLDVAPYNEQNAWNYWWTGLIQYPGQSHPRWANRSLVDAMSVWRDYPNYGSTLNTVAYAGIWGGSSRRMDLYMTAPASNFNDNDFLDFRPNLRVNNEAFVACEATRDNFCKKTAPHVNNADKSIVDYNKLRYTCKDGWEFKDHSTYRDIDCSHDCDLHYYSNVEVEHCILKNPCKADVDLCKPHGYCIFTNEYQRPYYCLCKKGYEWDVYQHKCVDINECAEDDPCGSYYGHCINTEGSYWCQCKQGYGWDDNNHCTSFPGSPVNPGYPAQPVIHTMTIYFHVKMNFLPDMNVPGTEIHGYLKAALEQLTAHVYGGDTILINHFYIAGEQYGNMKIKVVFNIYVQADVRELSVYAWKFYNYIGASTRYFTVNHNTYPYYGSIYFESTKYSKQITVNSPCSIFDAIGQCHGSTCESHGYKPACVCREGYYGEFCENTKDVPEVVRRPDTLTSAEIGLIVAVVILFICVICITMCLCCLLPRSCCYRGFYRHGHAGGHVAPVYGRSLVAPVCGTSGAAYVSRGPILRSNYPKFI